MHIVTHKIFRGDMVTNDSEINFGFPSDWERCTEGGRSVFRTPLREEIIASATRVAGDVQSAERARVIERVFENCVEVAKRTGSERGLRVTKPLTEEPGLCSHRCATVLAETTKRDAFFGLAVIQHPHGVLFLTYDAPFVDGAHQSFHDVLRLFDESRRAR